MGNSILYFLLLKLEIPLNLCLDVGHKWGRFFEILLEKDFEFVLRRGDGIVVSYLSFVLLLAKINLFSEEQGHKKDVFRACGTGHIKIVFALLAKIVVLYV